MLAPEALALAEGLGDQRRASQVCQRATGALARYGGAAVWGTPTYHAWAARADRYASPDGADRVQADTALARSARATGDYARSRELNHRALEAARRLGDPEILFFVAGSVLGAGDWLPSDFATCADLARELVARPADGVSTNSLSVAWRFSFIWLLTAGDRKAAEAVAQRGRELADRSRDPRPLAATIAWGMHLATLDGDFPLALAEGEREIALGEDTGTELMTRNDVARQFAPILVYLGRAAESVHAFDELFELAGDARDRDVMRRALSAAYAAPNAETLDALRTLLLEGLAAIGDGQAPAEILCRLLEAAIVLSDAEAAAALIPPLAPLAALAQCRTADIGAVGRLLGDGAVLLGDRESALDYYRRALEATTRIRHRPEAALTHLALAELALDEVRAPTPTPPPTLREGPDDSANSPLPRLGEGQGVRADAQAHLDFAIEEFRAMKMQPFLERALRHKGLLRA